MLNMPLTLSATAYPDSKINNNDLITSVQIYNAAALGLTNVYHPVALMYNGTEVPQLDTQYDAESDKLIWNVWSFEMPLYSKVTFTKAV